MPTLPHPWLLFWCVLLLGGLALHGLRAVGNDVRNYMQDQRRAVYAAAERAVGLSDVPALHRALRRQWWPLRRLSQGALHGLMRDAIHRGHIPAIHILAPLIRCGGEGSANMIAAALVRWTYRPDVLDAVLDALYRVDQMRAHPLRKSDIVFVLRPGHEQDAAQRLSERLAALDRAELIAVAKPTTQAAPPRTPGHRRRM